MIKDRKYTLHRLKRKMRQTYLKKNKIIVHFFFCYCGVKAPFQALAHLTTSTFVSVVDAILSSLYSLLYFIGCFPVFL